MKKYTQKEEKDLSFWEENCKDDYSRTPISVLKYIAVLQKEIKFLKKERDFNQIKS